MQQQQDSMMELSKQNTLAVSDAARMTEAEMLYGWRIYAWKLHCSVPVTAPASYKWLWKWRYDAMRDKITNLPLRIQNAFSQQPKWLRQQQTTAMEAVRHVGIHTFGSSSQRSSAWSVGNSRTLRNAFFKVQLNCFPFSFRSYVEDC